MIRLGSHPKMKAVWTELMRHQRQDYHRTATRLRAMKVYPKWRTALEAAGENPNDHMPRVLLIFLANLLRSNITVPTKTSVLADIRLMKETALQCRTLATTDQESSGNWNDWANHWDREAKSLKRQASKVLLLERQRVPADVIGTIRGVILVMNDLFGSPLYKISATLAGIISNHLVNHKQIENHAGMLKGSMQRAR